MDADVSTWIVAVNDELEALVRLDDDWDTYGSSPPSATAIRLSVRLLDALVEGGLPVPRVRGTAEGGVTIEWFSPEIEVVLEVEPIGSGVIAFLRNRSTGATLEGPLADVFDDIAVAFNRLRSAS